MLKRLAALVGLGSPKPAPTVAPQAAPGGDQPSAEEWKNRGNAHMARGELDEAARCYRQSIASDPGYAQAYNNLGLLLKQQGQPGAAREHLTKAVSLAPQLFQGHFNLGGLAKDAGELDIAARHFRRCLEINPDDENAILELAHTLLAQNQGDSARLLLQQALEHHPGSADLQFYLANVLKETGALDEACAAYEATLRIKEDHWPAALNLGLTHQDRQDWAAAEKYLRLAARPTGNIDAQLSLGGLLLLLGRLDEGFAQMEQRLAPGAPPDYAYVPRTLQRLGGKPRWAGEPLAGKKLLVWGEQGLGDTLMMARYLPRLKALGANELIVCVQPHLIRMFRQLDCVDRIENLAAPTLSPAFDLHCPCMSLPHLLGTTLETIPADVPYLTVPADLRDAWRQRLAPLPGLRVGIVWAGNPTLHKDAQRSIPLRQWASVLSTPGVSFISLQKGAATSQRSEGASAITDRMDECEDMLDTAALIDGLDLVICVDTSIAHLAGALGKPVWMLNRFGSEWRWLIDRADSPWYPTMRIFNQDTLDNWQPCLESVASALRQLADGPTQPASA